MPQLVRYQKPENTSMVTIMAIVIGVLAFSLLMAIACLVKNKISKSKKKNLFEQNGNTNQEGIIEPQQIVYYEPDLFIDDIKVEI